MFGKYKVAHLIGIARNHESQFRTVEWELTKQGYICFCPPVYDLDEYSNHREIIDDMCYEKLKVCDIVVIATPEHIGVSTNGRIKQATDLGKPVFSFDFDNNALVEYGMTEPVHEEEQCDETTEPAELATGIKEAMIDYFEKTNQKQVNLVDDIIPFVTDTLLGKTDSKQLQMAVSYEMGIAFHQISDRWYMTLELLSGGTLDVVFRRKYAETGANNIIMKI